MTAKRFEFREATLTGMMLPYVYDKSRQKYLNPLMCVDLLNELDEDFDDALNTISKIQEENQALQEEIKDYNDVLARLEEQNEQLKKENKRLDDLLGEECVREYMQILGETALKEMHDERYGGKDD